MQLNTENMLIFTLLTKIQKSQYVFSLPKNKLTFNKLTYW